MNKSFYFDPVKIVRDLVHEYINLTEFDIQIIDTIQFQRLKDIRQLTCQQVYPSACHTRFEHSLGVLELTRQAIKNLNKNQIIGADKCTDPIIDDNLAFNAAVAALLHDVGHCPFSHLGELEFDKKSVQNDLYYALRENEQIRANKDFLKRFEPDSEECNGAVHEQLSCIIILDAFTQLLPKCYEDREQIDGFNLYTDYELIVRSILGIEYSVDTIEKYEKNKKKNVIVRLIHSDVFDMDRLDYIMRDSFYTGIGTPVIDTKRLFRNMHFNQSLSLVFTSRAVPALQNMIDARDGLYMYVYNHHSAVFSDFLNAYIVRKFSRHADRFLRVIFPDYNEERLGIEKGLFHISSLGLIPKDYFFSTSAIVSGKRSDSDWISMLTIFHYNYDEYSLDTLSDIIFSEMRDWNDIDRESLPDGELDSMAKKIHATLELVHQYKNRKFLKPWWKTSYDFTNFMNRYFRDDSIRRPLLKFICSGGKFGLDAAEFRSQIAKHVIGITKYMEKDGGTTLFQALGDGEFFVIQRETRFFSPDMIKKIEVALRNSEIIGPPKEADNQSGDWYVKALTNIIPQKDYSSIYAKEGFYVFSKQLPKNTDEIARRKHYETIEQIFVFVAGELVRMGEHVFVDSFQKRSNENQRDYEDRALKNELESFKKTYERFKKQSLVITIGSVEEHHEKDI